jgi:hypothetical protein
MASSGGPPDDAWERIRPAPRPLASGKGRVSRRADSPEPGAPVRRAFPPLPKPDRARMDPENFEAPVSTLRSRSSSRIKTRARETRASTLDRWLARLGYCCLTLFLGGAGWWFLSRQPKASLPPAAPPSVPVQVTESGAGPRVLAMLQAFWSAPGVEGKAAYVIDAPRVKPLMSAAYQSGSLPEASLEFGVPLVLEPGLLQVPARVAGPPEFLLHLIVKEEQGRFLLDWETYEQEMSRRFTTFATKPGSPAGDFRVVLERAHSFGPGSDAAPAVRVAAPGSPALAQLVQVSAGARAAIIQSLPWNQRRRALVRLRWESADGAAPMLVLEEMVRWDFLP